MTRPRARCGSPAAPDEAGAATLLGVALAGQRGEVGATSRADGCLAADRVALANGAALTACTPEGSAVLVTVRVDAPPGLDRVLVIEARARAGPAP